MEKENSTFKFFSTFIIIVSLSMFNLSIANYFGYDSNIGCVAVISSLMYIYIMISAFENKYNFKTTVVKSLIKSLFIFILECSTCMIISNFIDFKTILFAFAECTICFFEYIIFSKLK